MIKLNHVLALLLVSCGYFTTQSNARGQAAQISRSTINSTICVVGFSRPIAVRFLDSIPLTEALQRAGVSTDSIKDEVVVLRRLETKLIRLTKINLKTIRKKRALDIRLDQHDLVFVNTTKKQRLTIDESTSVALHNCGGTLIPGMHGPLIVPKEWKPSDPSDGKKTNP